MDPQLITQNIRARRSVFPKNYTGEPVNDEVIYEMLENANWAPTHKLTEPWRFRVFTGPGLQKLGNYQASRYKEAALLAGTFDETKFQKLQAKPLLCSHMVSIGMARDPEARVPEIEEIASVSCAVMNMWLTASANGIGCYWSTGGVTYDQEAKSFFGLGPQDLLMGFLNIGIPQFDPRARTPGPVEDKVEWVRG